MRGIYLAISAVSQAESAATPGSNCRKDSRYISGERPSSIRSVVKIAQRYKHVSVQARNSEREMRVSRSK